MPDYELYKQSTSAERIKMARNHLRENPYIAAAHFERRFRLLLKHVQCLGLLVSLRVAGPW
jgi:hypothetical protein